MSNRLLTIGELAHRTGIATSALRYWEELGLLPAPIRVSGQRRYSESAVTLVGIILLLRDVGFSLAEQQALMAARADGRSEWREFMRRKLVEIDDQIARAQVVREALDHALHCPHEDIFQCPSFARTVSDRLEGRTVQEAHSHS